MSRTLIPLRLRPARSAQGATTAVGSLARGDLSASVVGIPNIQRSREGEALLDSRQRTSPDVVSACEGWTAHELTAHLASTAAEITRHLAPYLQGDEVPTTRAFEEREPPYRSMDDDTLCRRLLDEEEKMRSVIGQVLAIGAIFATPAPLAVRITSVRTTCQLATVVQLGVDVTNTSSRPQTPAFTVESGGQLTAFWLAPGGPSTLRPGPARTR